MLLRSGVGLDGLVARLGFGWGLSARPWTSSDGCRCFCFAALVAGVRQFFCLRLCIAAWRCLSVGIRIPGGAELRSSMYSISGAFAFGICRPPQASLGLGDSRSWGWGGLAAIAAGFWAILRGWGSWSRGDILARGRPVQARLAQMGACVAGSGPCRPTGAHVGPLGPLSP